MASSAALLAGTVAISLLLLYLSRRPRYRLPPGPKGLPGVGNLYNAPKVFEWLVYQDWARQYDSDIIHFEIFGTHYYVLNSTKAVTDLFERRSGNYSDKPAAPMLYLTGWDRNWGMMKYGDYWRAHRRLFHQYFRSTIVSRYHPMSTKAVRQMIQALRDTPDHFLQHIRFMAGYNILGIIYGMDVKPKGDPNLALVEEALHIFSKSATGTYLVDSFPSLRHIPAWFPGAQFQRDAARWKQVVDEMYMRPYRELKTSFENGDPRPCIVTDMLSGIPEGIESDERTMLENVVINTAGTAYAAASDTTTATLSTFVLAVLTHPEAQLAAQRELDVTIGRDRLPEMADRDALPYITALMKECMRWRPSLPIAVAHQSVTDDEYKGYDIPAGSIVVGNAWAILHDEERYPNPEAFDPARFLDDEGGLRKDVLDPMEAFGYGRRICPGRYFALDFIWLAMANILAAYTIDKPIDELGNVVEPTGEYVPGVVSHPAPFKAVFKPRGSVDIIM